MLFIYCTIVQNLLNKTIWYYLQISENYREMSKNNNTYINDFLKNGYVVIKGLLSKDDLEPVIDEYTILLDKMICKWYREGKLKNQYNNQSFEERLINISKEIGDDFYQPMDISLPQHNILTDTPMHYGQGIFNLLINTKLLAAVEMFIGPEIYSNPVQHVRLKVPEQNLDDFDLVYRAGIQHTFWHQDQGVINEEADSSNILTVWVAMTESTPENGCLQVIPKSHNSGLNYHCFSKNQTGIPDHLLKQEPVLLTMDPGDVLFLTKLTEHSSIPNKGNKIRWSFDLRYNPIGDRTGRDIFPGFIAKSIKSPASELRDYKVWQQSWINARAKVAEMYASESKPKFNRWDPNDPVCA